MEREPSSIYWQIATTHAVMRAHGAYYVANYMEMLEPPRSLIPDLDQEPLPSRLILSYNIDTMHMGSPEPFVRTAELFPRLSYAFRLLGENAQSQRRDLPNGLDVSVLLPTWVDNNGRFPAQQCPPVPSASWAARFQLLMDGL